MLDGHYAKKQTKQTKVEELEAFKREVQAVKNRLSKPRFFHQLVGDFQLKQVLGKKLPAEMCESIALEAEEWGRRQFVQIQELLHVLEFGVKLLKRRPENGDERLARAAKPAVDHITEVTSFWWKRHMGPIDARESSQCNKFFTRMF